MKFIEAKRVNLNKTRYRAIKLFCQVHVRSWVNVTLFNFTTQLFYRTTRTKYWSIDCRGPSPGKRIEVLGGCGTISDPKLGTDVTFHSVAPLETPNWWHTCSADIFLPNISSICLRSRFTNSWHGLTRKK